MASNTLDWRVVRRGRYAADGGVLWDDNVTQVRTKDMVISILGVSLGSWSGWRDLPPAPPLPAGQDYFYTDLNGGAL